MRWRVNTKSDSILLNEAIEGVSPIKILPLIPMNEILSYLHNDCELNNGTLEHTNYNTRKAECTYIDVEVDVGPDDIDISEYSDSDIIDEYNDRKLYLENNVGFKNNLENFLLDYLDVPTLSVYTNDELFDIIKSKLGR